MASETITYYSTIVLPAPLHMISVKLNFGEPFPMKREEKPMEPKLIIGNRDMFSMKKLQEAFQNLCARKYGDKLESTSNNSIFTYFVLALTPIYSKFGLHISGVSCSCCDNPDIRIESISSNKKTIFLALGKKGPEVFRKMNSLLGNTYAS